MILKNKSAKSFLLSSSPFTTITTSCTERGEYITDHSLLFHSFKRLKCLCNWMKQRNEAKSRFQSIQSSLLRKIVERLLPIVASTGSAQRFLEHLGIATFETQASLTLHNVLNWERISRHELLGTGPSWWAHYLIQPPQWPIRAFTEKIRGQGKTTWPGWFYHQSLSEMRPCFREGGQSLQEKVLAGPGTLSTVRASHTALMAKGIGRNLLRREIGVTLPRHIESHHSQLHVQCGSSVMKLSQ